MLTEIQQRTREVIHQLLEVADMKLGQLLAVEKIGAHAGIDIGDALIGMHLRAGAVPVRIEMTKIGGAHVVCARTRLKHILHLSCPQESILKLEKYRIEPEAGEHLRMFERRIRIYYCRFCA